MTAAEIVDLAEITFVITAPRMTLREGNAIDSYKDPCAATDEESRPPEDGYLEEFHGGIAQTP